MMIMIMMVMMIVIITIIISWFQEKKILFGWFLTRLFVWIPAFFSCIIRYTCDVQNKEDLLLGNKQINMP